MPAASGPEMPALSLSPFLPAVPSTSPCQGDQPVSGLLLGPGAWPRGGVVGMTVCGQRF